MTRPFGKNGCNFFSRKLDASNTFMTHIHPNLDWYSTVGDQRGKDRRCPFATVNRCPKYFETLVVLEQQYNSPKIPRAIQKSMVKKWREDELWAVTLADKPKAIEYRDTGNHLEFRSLCPEASFEVFELFTSSISYFKSTLDFKVRELQIKDTVYGSMHWHWVWQYFHVEPMHFSDCSMFGKISKEKAIANVTISGVIHGQVNIAGEHIDSPSYSITIGEIAHQIDLSKATDAEKSNAKSKLQELLAHPIVTAIVSGVAGRVGG